MKTEIIKDSRQSPLFLISLTLIIILIIAVFILSATPPISTDALTHHLYVPKLWIQQGSVDPIPYISFSYYPMNLDLLYAIPLYFGNDIIPKYIHFSFALLTGWMIYNYISIRLTKAWGVFGALFFLSLPIIVKLSISAYVDLGLVAFSTASILLLFKWAESKKNYFLALSGLFCGVAAGTKYNGLICIFLLTLLTPIIYSRSKLDRSRTVTSGALFFMCLFLIATFISFSPWLIRNYKITGNPIYPLYHSLFQIDNNTNNSSLEKALNPIDFGSIFEKMTSRRSSTFTNRKVLYNETWWQTLLLPARFFFEGQDGNPRFFDGMLNPFLLLFMLFSFFHYRFQHQTRQELYLLFFYGWLFFFFHILPGIPSN